MCPVFLKKINIFLETTKLFLHGAAAGVCPLKELLTTLDLNVANNLNCNKPELYISMPGGCSNWFRAYNLVTVEELKRNLHRSARFCW